MPTLDVGPRLQAALQASKTGLLNISANDVWLPSNGTQDWSPGDTKSRRSRGDGATLSAGLRPMFLSKYDFCSWLH